MASACAICVKCGKPMSPGAGIVINSRTFPEIDGRKAHKACYKRL